MNVGWKAVRLIKRSDADEPNRVAAAHVVAPDSDPTLGTSGDLLPLATARWRIDDVYLALKQLHALGFYDRIQRKGGASFALAPAAVAAVAAVNEQARRQVACQLIQPIPVPIERTGIRHGNRGDRACTSIRRLGTRSERIR